MYATKCSGCKTTIPANEFVMRALGNVYHLQCFLCAMCGQRLVKGQEFALKDNKLYCKEDYGKLTTKGSSKSPPHKQQQESKSQIVSDSTLVTSSDWLRSKYLYFLFARKLMDFFFFQKCINCKSKTRGPSMGR